MLSRVIAKNVGDVFFETQCSSYRKFEFSLWKVFVWRVLGVLASRGVEICFFRNRLGMMMMMVMIVDLYSALCRAPLLR